MWLAPTRAEPSTPTGTIGREGREDVADGRTDASGTAPGALPRLDDEAGVERADGVLFDLGVSSMQLDRAERGFGFRTEGPLDMRMDPSTEPSAEDVVNGYPEQELARVIFEFGEERQSRR